MKRKKEYLTPKMEVIRHDDYEILAASPPYIPVNPDDLEMDPDDDAG